MLSLSSFEEMIDKVVDDELSELLRGSHDEQANYIKKTFDVDISKGFAKWGDYLEVFERRNIAAHNNLVVDKQYLRNIKRQTGVESEFKINEQLNIDDGYISRCVSLCTEAGGRLIFEIWRKYGASKAEPAYAFMNEFCFNLIKNNKPKLAIRLLTYMLDASTAKHPEKYRRMMAVNLANAHKICQEPKKADAALNRFQWDASSDQFRICVAAVRDEIDVVVDLMGNVSGDSVVGMEGFRGWPVFESARRDPSFIAEFERLFGEPLVSADSPAEMNPLETGRSDPSMRETARDDSRA